jgi:hypothetical protein
LSAIGSVVVAFVMRNKRNKNVLRRTLEHTTGNFNHDQIIAMEIKLISANPEWIETRVLSIVKIIANGEANPQGINF